MKCGDAWCCRPAHWQGQRPLHQESLSTPLREGEVSTQAESPALSCGCGACLQTSRLTLSWIRAPFGRVSAGSTGLETMRAFLPALGASFGVDKISYWRKRRRRRKLVAKHGCPRCFPRVSPLSGAPVSAKPLRSRRASTNKPAALSSRQGTPGTSAGPNASFPPARSSSSAQGQSQEEASVCVPRVSRSGCPSRSLQTAPQKRTVCGYAFLWVWEGHLPFAERSV